MRIERLDWDGADAPALAARLRAAGAGRSARSRAEVAGSSSECATAATRRCASRRRPRRARSPESLARRPGGRSRRAPGLLEPEAARGAAARRAQHRARWPRAELERASARRRSSCPRARRSRSAKSRSAAPGVYAPGGRAAYPSSVPDVLRSPPASPASARIAVACPPGRGRAAPRRGARGLRDRRRGRGLRGRRSAGDRRPGVRHRDDRRRSTWSPGPGNRYVTEAKRLVFGDGRHRRHRGAERADGGRRRDRRTRAGSRSTSAPRPSTATDSPLIVASPDVALLDRIAELVDELAAERPSVADAPLALVATPGSSAALTLADAVAPEHLELAFEGADENAARGADRRAACSSGAGGATAFGDYAAGSNHVLPTGGAARFGGPLGPAHVPAPDLGRHAARRRRRGPRAPRRRPGPRRGLSRARRVGRGARRADPQRCTAGLQVICEPMSRTAEISRKTSETEVTVALDLDGGEVSASTGVGFLDHMLELLGRHGRLGLRVEASGDLETGAHHTVEDVGIALGQALDRALGDRAGIRRYGYMAVPMDEALGMCAIDISGRPLCLFEADLPAVSIAGLRHRAGRGVLPRRRHQREADPAPRDALRLQRPPHDRGVLQGVRAGRCARRSRSTRARAGSPRPRGPSPIEHDFRRDPRLRHGQPALGREGARAGRRRGADHRRPGCGAGRRRRRSCPASGRFPPR